jgi:hypothetical protein
MYHPSSRPVSDDDPVFAGDATCNLGGPCLLSGFDIRQQRSLLMQIPHRILQGLCVVRNSRKKIQLRKCAYVACIRYRPTCSFRRWSNGIDPRVVSYGQVDDGILHTFPSGPHVAVSCLQLTV